MNKLPAWAPRVAQSKIRAFYESDARGLYDGELIDDLGCSLLAGCENVIAASLAYQGEVACPNCGVIVKREETLHCRCGWLLPWTDYFGTIQHKQLSGAEPVLEAFREFLRAFPLARTWREKTLLIDTLIHRFHLSLQGHETRPAAVNLVEGSMNSVIALLNDLTYGDQSTTGIQATSSMWKRSMEESSSRFRASARRRS